MMMSPYSYSLVPTADSADAISNDLVAAGLLEMRTVVVGTPIQTDTCVVPSSPCYYGIVCIHVCTMYMNKSRTTIL